MIDEIILSLILPIEFVPVIIGAVSAGAVRVSPEMVVTVAPEAIDVEPIVGAE